MKDLSDVEKTIFPSKKVHFTYKEKEQTDQSNLCQGDLIKITDELRDVLKEIHPYFLGPQYQYFMVLTQSCDLVRRNKNKCKTPYITLAAVKEFEPFFEKQLLSKKMVEDVNGVLLMNNKNWERAYQFLERLYNNTEPEYFFLYREDMIGINRSLIATLKVSIAIKSDIHYDKCLKGKVLELSDEFKAKLGWLVGNMYSRVGTTDWESIKTESERKEMIREELLYFCIKGEKPQIDALKKEIRNNSEHFKTKDDVIEFIDNYHIKSKYDQVIEVLEDIVNTSSGTISSADKEKLINTIKSRSMLKTLLAK